MRKEKKQKIIFGLVFVLAAFLGMQSNVGKAHAIVTSQVDIQKSIRDKAVLQGVQGCYTRFVRREVKPSSYKGISSIMTENANEKQYGNYVPLVSGSEGKGIMNAIWGGNSDYNVKDDGLSCYELFNGAGSNAKPILEVFDKKEPSGPEATNEFLTNMGYDSDPEKGNSDEECYSALYTRDGTEHSSNTVCRNKTDGKLRVEKNSENAMEFYVDNGLFGGKNQLCLRLFKETDAGRADEEMGCSSIEGSLNPTSFHLAILDICGSETCEFNYSGAQGSTILKFRGDQSGYKQQASGDADEVSLGNGAAMRAVNYLAGPGANYDNDSIRFDRPEQRILYQEYLRSYYGVEINCDEGALGGENPQTVWWFDYKSGEMRECVTTNNGNSNKDKPTNGVQLGRLQYHSIDNMDALIGLLNSDDMRNYNEEEMYKMGGLEGEESADQANNPGESSEIIKDCRNSGAAKTLGWILCAALEIMGDASKSFYEKMVEPSLRVRSYLFTSDIAPESSIPYTAWERFRDIANVVFAIFLLFVIFSQLTGVGIDNYGIKRVLPRLVVAVVLINLSYLICMIFVDVSNIVGNGLQEMFNGFGSALQTEQIRIQDAYPAGTSEGSAFPLATVGNIIVSVALIAGLATMWGEIWAFFGPFLVLTLIFAAISIIITMVFLYFFLAVRQAAIIVLVVTSPLAVVCYFLPNTKTIFDKFIKIFRALLLVYPTAALLVGGGNYVAKLILATGGAEDSFFLAVTAMIMGIVPVLFLPGIVKSAIAFIPKFGEMFNGWENKARDLSSRAKSGIQRSEMFQALQNNARLGGLRSMAGVDKNGEAVPLNRLQRLRRGGNSGIAKYRSLLNQHLLQQERDEMWNSDDYLKFSANNREATLQNEREKMYSDAFSKMDPKAVQNELRKALTGNKDKYASARSSAALKTLIQQGNISEAFDVLNGLDENGEEKGARVKLDDWSAITGKNSAMSGFVDAMRTSGVDSMKAYAKYSSSGGQASFRDWFTGEDKDDNHAIENEKNNANIKAKTYAGHLMEGGATALNNVDKDELKAIKANADAIRQQMEKLTSEDKEKRSAEAGTNMFGAMITNAALDNSDAKAKTIAEDITKQQIGDGYLRSNNLDLTQDKVSRMRSEQAQAIQKGYRDRYGNDTVADNTLRTEAGILKIMNELKNNPQAYGRTASGVLEVFGGNVAPQAPGGNNSGIWVPGGPSSQPRQTFRNDGTGHFG